ncbi:hypothetical protein SARC_10913 [Sphaeroforma arctica JP610]|uniref:Uncharacterized protein n=1 Tax=Sphaeroforma arctica JP610 TaxID=667725 RepID=A0A0L0FIJ7_9EUKA|nr:hypothetical protein SARC_10913 [Sphaeroforma arctica JP610]KNC76597.1 hypothetical protein SARC_10913 [Sphaeroforma arctica JP610]|eukprot:XP_014150499.1 hypothetical protein SARC_10913 [Sphaeroforma arctica JP610]
MCTLDISQNFLCFSTRASQSSDLVSVVIPCLDVVRATPVEYTDVTNAVHVHAHGGNDFIFGNLTDKIRQVMVNAILRTTVNKKDTGPSGGVPGGAFGSTSVFRLNSEGSRSINSTNDSSEQLANENSSQNSTDDDLQLQPALMSIFGLALIPTNGSLSEGQIITKSPATTLKSRTDTDTTFRKASSVLSTNSLTVSR